MSSTPQMPVQTEREVTSARMILTMALIGLLAGFLIVFTYRTTLPIIEKNKQEYLERAIFEVLPNAAYKEVFIVTPEGKLEPTTDIHSKAPKVYAGYTTDGKLVGVALEARGQGFQDVISLIYGYDPYKQIIIGMKVLESKETPGLGSKIENDPDFLANFKALVVKLTPDGKIEHPVELVKKGKKTHDWQIEAITGATISSRAVTNILRKSTATALPIIANNLQVLESAGKKQPSTIKAQNQNQAG